MELKTNFPHIAPDKAGIPTLYVDGKPFWMLSGELHNSSASGAEYMEDEVWPFLRGMNMNTVLLTVAWEDIEPEEGAFDFSIVQALLDQARREDMRLVLLWFGLWKNGESFYVPRWVKDDTDRFFRARYKNGTASETISPLCREAVEKDKTAFCRLMSYLAEHDDQHTVITVQVENEIGMLNAERDYGEQANALYTQPVPAEVAALYNVSGTWEEAFGPIGCRYFMGYYYALAVEVIASAGKAIWPLPMYVNAWQDQFPFRPGCYPSGGPIAPLVPLWLQTAPSIDFCSPDIYVPEFVHTCERYLVDRNALFVPETYRTALSATNALYFFAKLGGIGFSPFGVEDMPKMPTKDGETPEWKYIAESYRLLAGAKDRILKDRANGRVDAFVQRFPGEWGHVVYTDRYDIQFDYIDAGKGKPGAGGILIFTDDGFYLIGCNVKFKVWPKLGSDDIVGLLRVEDGEFVDGVWKRRRVLNGDEILPQRNKIDAMPECRFIGVNLHR